MSTTGDIIKEVPLEVVWDIRHRVMYPELTIADVRLSDDADALHPGLYRDGRLVSVVSLFSHGSALQFRKFATETSEQGKGFGSQLLEHVITYACAGHWSLLWCNARLSAAAFYERFGMVQTGDGWNQLGHDFIRMEKQVKSL